MIGRCDWYMVFLRGINPKFNFSEMTGHEHLNTEKFDKRNLLY